jgi:hypothetical protein
MKAYKWLTLSAAIAINLFLHMFFTSATRNVSPVETHAEVVDNRSRLGHSPSEFSDESRRLGVTP